MEAANNFFHALHINTTPIHLHRYNLSSSYKWTPVLHWEQSPKFITNMINRIFAFFCSHLKESSRSSIWLATRYKGDNIKYKGENFQIQSVTYKTCIVYIETIKKGSEWHFDIMSCRFSVIQFLKDIVSRLGNSCTVMLLLLFLNLSINENKPLY